MQYLKGMILLLFFSFIVGCGQSDDILIVDKIIGYWEVNKEIKELINGVQENEYTQKRWVEFYKDNEGQIFDEFENPSSEIRWTYEERDDFDRMLIFYKLGGNNTLDLYTDEFNEVVKLKDNEFILFNTREEVLGDSTIVTNTYSYFERQ